MTKKMKFPETKWMSFPVKWSGPDRLAHDPENIIFKTISVWVFQDLTTRVERPSTTWYSKLALNQGPNPPVQLLSPWILALNFIFRILWKWSTMDRFHRSRTASAENCQVATLFMAHLSCYNSLGMAYCCPPIFHIRYSKKETETFISFMVLYC